jgi:hypothetical protein
MSDPLDALGADLPTTTAVSNSAPPLTVRARKRREDAVRRLLAEVQAIESETGTDGAATSSNARRTESNEWLVCRTTAAALEKGLDRDYHTELVHQAKDNATRIGQICQDHAEVFLDSVGQVAALLEPTAQVSHGLDAAQAALQRRTVGPMQEAALLHAHAAAAHQRAVALRQVVRACQQMALQLERARKQASAGRPRAALAAVAQARHLLTRPINNMTLEETPFGKRALQILPKVETEVLGQARRGLNRWFLTLREDQAVAAGRAVLRQCAAHLSTGHAVGLGAAAAFSWRAKTADNLLARLPQSHKLARATRAAYWFHREAVQEAEKVEDKVQLFLRYEQQQQIQQQASAAHPSSRKAVAVAAPQAWPEQEGIVRKAEALAAAFGWYRCWDEGADLLVDAAAVVSDFASRHGAAAGGNPMSGSTHGSRHGGGSRHGRSSKHGKGRSLGFRATTSSKSLTFAELSSNLGGMSGPGHANNPASVTSQWNELLHPVILYEAHRRGEEEAILWGLPESVHPVRRAELAYTLLGRSDDFVQYYEQNRFGETKVEEGGSERKSYLSSLTGDDVTLGNDRIFFSKILPHLAASVVGFCAVEAALELGHFEDEDDEEGQGGTADDGEEEKKTESRKTAKNTSSRFRTSSERYERALVTELGNIFRQRAVRATLPELVRASNLISSFRAALRIVHPSSAVRRHDKGLLALDVDILMTAIKIAQDEQLKATASIVQDDPKTPLLLTDPVSGTGGKNAAGIPDPEETGLPFGLAQMKQQTQKADKDFQEQSRTSFNRASMDEAYTFSQSVPVVLRSIHARSVAIAAFAISQQELGINFPDKLGSNAGGFVLDCVEECINVAAVGMKDSDNVVDEGSVEKAVQVMANITALQHCIPRLYGTLLRGMCHVGLIRADEVEETFEYADKSLKNADKACDAQIGSTYSLVYEICRSRIDTHVTYALENFNWVAKSIRDMPNAYCEGLIGYLKSVFASLGPMDEGSRAGLHFSCCGHVSERLVYHFSGKPGDVTTMDPSGVQPLTKIDAFGIKNLSTDCAEMERFADSTGVPQLRDCFSELKTLTRLMLDKDMPNLLQPSQAAARRRKYPILSLEKVANILDKYVGTGLSDKLMGSSTRNQDILFIDKKEVQQLLKIVKGQIH